MTQLTESQFNSLIQKGIAIYHAGRGEEAITSFLIGNGCGQEQADQMTRIVVNDHDQFIFRRKQAWVFIISGIMALVLGTWLTIFSYNQAKGGTDWLFWGLVATGISLGIKGLYDLPKKNVLKRVD